MIALQLTVEGLREPLGIYEDIKNSDLDIHTDIRYENINRALKGFHVEELNKADEPFNAEDMCTTIRFTTYENKKAEKYLIIINNNLSYQLHFHQNTSNVAQMIEQHWGL